MENEFPKRKPIRLSEFDYSQPGAYFITICTQNRRRMLSQIVGDGLPDVPQTELSQYGKIADAYIQQLNDYYADIEVEQYVIMPNHMHIMLIVSENGTSRTPSPTTRQNAIVSRFVSTFKRFCNKEYGCNIWQRGYYDHIIRSRADHEEHLRYIYENPLRWYYDELYIEE